MGYAHSLFFRKSFSKVGGMEWDSSDPDLSHAYFCCAETILSLENKLQIVSLSSSSVLSKLVAIICGNAPISHLQCILWKFKETTFLSLSDYITCECLIHSKEMLSFEGIKLATLIWRYCLSGKLHWEHKAVFYFWKHILTNLR